MLSNATTSPERPILAAAFYHLCWEMLAIYVPNAPRSRTASIKDEIVACSIVSKVTSSRKRVIGIRTPMTGPRLLLNAFMTLPYFFCSCTSVSSRFSIIDSSMSWIWASFSAFSISHTLQTPEVANPIPAPMPTLKTVRPSSKLERKDLTVTPVAVSVSSNPLEMKYLREIDLTSSLCQFS